MKQYCKIIFYFYSACALCAPIFLEATNWVVDNTGGGNFTSIGAAVTSPSVVSGDTILITAGQIFTGADNRGITISKNLIFNSTDPSDTMPRIDLLNSNLFCIINVGITVFMHNLDIRNGNGGGSSNGGAIRNDGILYMINCILKNNHVSQQGGVGGAISNGTQLLTAVGCTFEANSTIFGGVISNNPGGTSHISCCRFIGNSANFGDAIYSFNGTVDATNNWWGSNSPDASKLFYALSSTITYVPYLVINLLPDPLFVSSNCSTLITADFTQNSFGQDSDCDEFFGGEVLFSTSEGTITPTPVPLINGKATATLSDISGTSTLVLCALADADLTESFFEYCATATPISGMQAYVSPSGDDANIGTIISPVKTIARGIELATSCATTGTVYLQADSIFTGTGNKNIIITAAVHITKYDNGDNPVIDMESIGRFCTITSTATVSMNNLMIRNGQEDHGAGIYNEGGFLTLTSCTFNDNTAIGAQSVYGGALLNDNDGTLSISNCTFNRNSASVGGAICSTAGIIQLVNDTFTANTSLGGGAIADINGSTILHAVGCTFSKNDASPQMGGALLNSAGTANISCCRFIENTATNGDAIYNSSGTVEALNNWWGTNNPDPSVLFGGTSVGYQPYLEINILPDPLLVRISCQSEIAADFTQNSSGQISPCTNFFSGAVTFSSTEGTITPTISLLVDGKATGILSDITSFDPLSLCVFTDSDVATTPYEYCATASPISGDNAYVSSSGDDADPGTIDYPVKTIERGIEIATSCGVTGTVYLEAGSIFTGTGNKNLAIPSSVNITRYHAGANPIIDMEHQGRFCIINSDIAVSISDLVIRNGSTNDQGGAIYSTAGTLQLARNTFTGNSALGGGAIANINGGTFLHAIGCTFSKNTALQQGGAVLNSLGTANISCCRFIENTATNGDAIYNSSGTVEALNNWWGTNNPDPSALFGGTSVSYEPYLEINLLPHPLLVRIFCPSEIVADFTQNSSSQISPCTDFFSGAVTFSSTEGTITPTISLLIDGKATGILSDITSFDPLSLCVFTDSDVATTPYEYCATASPIYGNAYVSTSGDDTNPGTIDYPVRTIERGIEIVSSCVVTGTVYLEAGSIFTGTGNKNLTIPSSVIITRYHAGSNPIIDMEHIGRFCIINPDITVSISDLVLRNGFIVGQGGVIHNNGILNADRCTFTDNRATNGGAIEQDAGISEIHCCRFANNIATSGHGNAIYNSSGIVNADNNWWGSNTDPAAIANLLFGTITSSPWIQMAIDAAPIMVNVGQPTTLTVTFSSNCIPDGTPITFSTIDGLVTPTTCLTIHGTGSALASTDFSQAQFCATTDNQTVCTIFNTSGYARFNFGCMCTDSDNQQLLIGSYNDIEDAHNLLMGYIFDSSTNTTTAITPVDLESHIIENIVVYNTDSIVYIALLTKQNENCFLRLATCADSGLGFSFTLGDPISMSNQTMKIQWIVGTDGTPYIATDMQDTLSIFKADLSTLTLTPHDSVTNVAGATNSTFLYWAVQANGLYLVQGYDATHVATYKVNPGTGEFIGAGITTDVSSLFSVSRACSTCYNYLALGGTNTSHQAIVASYNINTDGTLEYIRSTTLPASQANYCERCCCNNSHLLVATDNGLYSINPETFDIIASNVTMINNTWINSCWCCDSSLTYCSAINSNHRSYIFQEQGTDLIKLLDL